MKNKKRIKEWFDEKKITALGIINTAAEMMIEFMQDLMDIHVQVPSFSFPSLSAIATRSTSILFFCSFFSFFLSSFIFAFIFSFLFFFSLFAFRFSILFDLLLSFFFLFPSFSTFFIFIWLKLRSGHNEHSLDDSKWA